MPISLFPNATTDKCEEMVSILEKEFAHYSQNSALMDEVELRINAAVSQAIENIVQSQTICAQHTFSAKVMQELTQLLRSCK
jgi:division protein CdvB (Snf7/Vps24/ESCRT-III family)